MVKSYKRYHTVLESAERWELSEDPLWISAVFGGRLFWTGSSRARALVQGPILHALSHIQLLSGTLLFPEAFLCSGSTSAGEDVGFGPVWHRDNLGTLALGSHQLHHPIPSGHSQQHEDSPTMNHCTWTWTKVSTCLFHPVFPCHPHALGAFGIIPRGGTGQPLKRGCCKAGFGNPLLWSKGAISNSKHFQQKLRRKKNKNKSQTEQRLHLKNSLVKRKSLLPLIFFVPRTCSVESLFIHVSPTARKRNIFILLKL